MDDYELNIDEFTGELPDLPSGHFDNAPDEAEQDAYLHPEDTDLDEYLSYDEYEEQEETVPESQPRREAESPKKSGGLFGFLKKRGAQVQPVQKAEPVETDGYYPDSDPNAVDYPDESGSSYEGGETAYDAEDDRGRLYATHSGARGRAEREARDLIASLQAESGAEARDRRLAEDYRVDLEDLLGIQNEEGEDIRPLPQAAKPEDEDEYHFGLDEALDIDADVKQYTGKHSTPAYVPDAAEPEIDERFNLGGQNTQTSRAYGDTEVDMSEDED